MLHLLKRHLIPIDAFLRHSLVLTYAYPRDLLQPLLSPGLVLDTYGDFGFLAIALVQTENMRPRFLPSSLGKDFFLSGYRIFTRIARAPSVRGLQILRSDTDRPFMVRAGNLLTRYRYTLCQAGITADHDRLHWTVRTVQNEANLDVVALINQPAAELPQGSPFQNLKDARRFAGPLPFTFEYEAETNSLLQIRGVRSGWNPTPVTVDVRTCSFLNHPPFCKTNPILANAFYLHDIPYRWERATRLALDAA